MEAPGDVSLGLAQVFRGKQAGNQRSSRVRGAACPISEGVWALPGRGSREEFRPGGGVGGSAEPGEGEPAGKGEGREGPDSG